MPPSRRLILKTPVILTGSMAADRAAGTQMRIPVAGAAVDLADCEATLAAFLDTLLPEHGPSPAASALGIPGRMLAVARHQPRYARLLQSGCAWLDGQARSQSRAAAVAGFADLSEAQRVAIAEAAEGAAGHLVQRQFFATLHRQALILFYTEPLAWRALGYPGPPQPVGFPDQADPPGTGLGR